MQVSYQDYSTVSRSRPVVLSSPTTQDLKNTYLQPTKYSEVGKLDKAFGENYNLRQIYSPYLAPSHFIVEQRTAKYNLTPVFVHNVARTKYFNISAAAKPSEHNKVNLYA